MSNRGSYYKSVERRETSTNKVTIDGRTPNKQTKPLIRQTSTRKDSEGHKNKWMQRRDTKPVYSRQRSLVNSNLIFLKTPCTKENVNPNNYQTCDPRVMRRTPTNRKSSYHDLTSKSQVEFKKNFGNHQFPQKVSTQILKPQDQMKNHKKVLQSSGYRVENARFEHGKVSSQDFVLSSSNFNSYALRTSSNFNFNFKPPKTGKM